MYSSMYMTGVKSRTSSKVVDNGLVLVVLVVPPHHPQWREVWMCHGPRSCYYLSLSLLLASNRPYSSSPSYVLLSPTIPACWRNMSFLILHIS